MNIVRLGGIAVVALSLAILTPPVGAERPRDTSSVDESTTGAEQREARFSEREYRHRVAKLRRLREIAVQRNDTDRLAEIDELSESLRRRHSEKISRLKGRMDERAARRLDEELADGRDRAEWVHEHREKARELRNDHRDKRQDARQAVRQEKAQRHQARYDQRTENREHRIEAHQEKYQEKSDARQQRHDLRHDQRVEHRQDRYEKRTDARQQKHDGRVEHRQDRYEKRTDARQQKHDGRVEHRQDHQQKRSDQRREVRGTARDRAENKRAEAREQADRSRNDSVSRRLDQRWRKEADGRSADRWERAARSRGMLSSDQPQRNFRMPSQREADSEMSTRISTANAEDEFRKLRREIDK